MHPWELGKTSLKDNKKKKYIQYMQKTPYTVNLDESSPMKKDQGVEHFASTQR